MANGSQRAATARAHANLAFVKYWGKADAALNVPFNGSISMNLSGATTLTTVVFDDGLLADEVWLRPAAAQGDPQLPLPLTLDDQTRPAGARFAQRISRHLDLLRSRAGVRAKARVTTANSFPAGAGIASSASGMAALTLAAATALGLDVGQRELTRLARRGSGSACRSIPAGFVEWISGADDETSYAEQIAPPDHWPLVDLAVVVSREAKRVSSSEGHALALASPFWPARLASMNERLAVVRRAIWERDFDLFGREVEAEALSMHAVALTSAHMDGDVWRSGVYYLLPDTLAVLLAVQEWRAQGVAVYFTLDAGPTVHLLCLADAADRVAEQVQALAEEQGRAWEVIVNRPGDGAVVVSDAYVQPAPP